MTQINLFTSFWKEAIKYLGWILLFVVLWFRGCSAENVKPQIVKIEVPEVKAKFVPKKPVHEAVKKLSPSRSQASDNKSIKENPIDEKLIAENEKLKADFAKANDSIKKLQFSKAIQLNKFSTNFEDENLILNIKGIVQGEVKEVTPGYTIKKKSVEVPVKQKETFFRVLAGGAVGVNKELSQAAYQLDLNFQNRKGDIISAEYLNVGGQSFGMVGFKKSILNIKR